MSNFSFSNNIKIIFCLLILSFWKHIMHVQLMHLLLLSGVCRYGSHTQAPQYANSTRKIKPSSGQLFMKTRNMQLYACLSLCQSLSICLSLCLSLSLSPCLSLCLSLSRVEFAYCGAYVCTRFKMTVIFAKCNKNVKGLGWKKSLAPTTPRRTVK